MLLQFSLLILSRSTTSFQAASAGPRSYRSYRAIATKLQTMSTAAPVA